MSAASLAAREVRRRVGKVRRAAAQPTLFDAPAGRVRHTDPVTSRHAARAQRGGAEAAIRALFLAGFEGTADEMCARLGEFREHTLKSALSRVDGVVASGRFGESACGRQAIVWRWDA